jgi:hypothetical protein
VAYAGNGGHTSERSAMMTRLANKWPTIPEDMLVEGMDIILPFVKEGSLGVYNRKAACPEYLKHYQGRIA